ncbi:MAG: ABC transporter substrate-binding protein [Alphaproteobacteria bacterium]|nr:MAG: ABC transporter substrate-binding protein [Alphaproteobacteria bacterium]
MAPSRRFGRQDFARDQAGRHSRPAADQIRSRTQLENGKGARPHVPRQDARTSRGGDRVKRRNFLEVLGGAAVAWPLAARAQQAAIPVVGFLRITVAAGSEPLVGAFRQGLNEAGFVEGQNIAVEYRWADDQDDRIPGMAVELVRRQVAVIVANGLAVPAVKAATATIPIVFTTGFDPVRTGLVASLSRPSGNATGVVFTQTDLSAKQLGLLHELAPKAAIIAVLGDPNQPELELELRDIEAAGRAIGRQILIVKAASEREFNAAFATVVQAHAGALLVRGSPLFLTRRRQLVALAVRHALLASYTSRDYVEVGGLMSYGPSITDAYRRVGIYVGRILKGAKPADLPVEMATKFDLVINLATAKAIDLDIPPMLLARADEVIE